MKNKKDAAECSGASSLLSAIGDDLPEEIRQLVGRCEINERSFDNDEMSLALCFGERLWHRIAMIATHYEMQATVDGHSESIRESLRGAAADLRQIQIEVSKKVKV